MGNLADNSDTNSTQPTPDALNEIFNRLEILINGSNPTNYIMGDEPAMKQRYDAFIQAKQAMQQLINEELIRELSKIKKLDNVNIQLANLMLKTQVYIDERLAQLKEDK